jgi:SAM-dependent methyltransferase
VTTYAILPPVSVNRVYGAAAIDLAAAELQFVTRADVERVELGGLAYLTFESDLDDEHRRRLSNLAGVHAVFEMRDDLLEPVMVEPRRACDDDVISIPRYVGKTNEQFTKLLVNVALAATDHGYDDELVLLDPVCGRGTTLSQAMVYGWHAWGIELDRKDLEAYRAFITRWLQDKRIKHESEATRTRLVIRYGYGRRTQEGGRTIDVVVGDTAEAASFFKPRTVDLVVADLPYGVQHGSRTDALRRSPEQLIVEALPGWAKLLKPGGAVGLSWNLRTLGRQAMEACLAATGLEPHPDLAGCDFTHVVDRSITRDLVVARRPSA